jgi:hypothetical protein
MATLDSDAHTTASEVTDIFETSLPDDVVVAYINAAVTKRKEIPDFDGFTAERKARIEKFLAAHYLTAQDPRAGEEEHESASVTYGGDGGEAADYLSVAAALDPTGTIGGDGGGAGATIDVPRVR